MSFSFDWVTQNLGLIVSYFVQHLVLAIVPVIIGLVVAIPIGWWGYRKRIVLPALTTLSGLIYTIPSLALLTLVPFVLPIQILSPLNIVIALSAYTVALLVRVVVDGLDTVPTDTVQAAEGMGYTGIQRFFRVELPVAVPVIGAGLRVAIVSNVSLVSVAALLGIPQLGQLFTQGLQLQNAMTVLVGIVLCVVLAFGLDALTLLLIRLATPWRRVQRGARA